MMAVMVLQLMVVMAASVSSKMIKNGLGTCLSYGDSSSSDLVFIKDEPQLGPLSVTTETCNSKDSGQTNWNVTVINHIYNYKGTMVMTVRFCRIIFNGKTADELCFSQEKISQGKLRNYLSSANSSDLTAMNWKNNVEFPYKYVSEKLGNCLTAKAPGKEMVNAPCMTPEIPSQQWTIVN